MNGLTEKRYRLNASQTAKGLWSLDCTIELSEDHAVLTSKTDVSDIREITIGEKLLGIIKEAEEAFRKDGKKLVGELEI